jgi:hypothetical protein
MWSTGKRTRIPVGVRARAAALAPAVATLALVATSPMGAELALAGGPSAARTFTGVYGGMTSNGWPVIAEVSRDGRRLRRIVGAIAADCSQGGGYTIPAQWRDLRISRSGAFRASYEDTDVADGVEITLSETLTGKLNRARTRITAVWRAAASYRAPDGTVDVCDSGALRVTLRQ